MNEQTRVCTRILKRGLWRKYFAAAASMAVLLSATVAADPLSSTDRSAALTAIEGAIRHTYVFPERTPAILAALKRSTDSGRYDTSDGDVFAQRVTDDLQAVSHDGHLYLRNDREHYRAASVPNKAANGLDAYARSMAIRDNSGLVAMNILPGNVRYLRISGFQWTAGLTRDTYDAALRFLRDGSAVIIDLRDNGGGESDAANYLLDAILKPGSVPYTRREGRQVTASRTRRNPAGLSLVGKSLFVLVDGHTGSAAEAVTYAVQQAKGGTVVGATTYGAANNNKIVPIAPQFVLSVSYARPISAVTGTNWEDVGVKPDIAVVATDALAAAQVAALDLLSVAPGTTAKELENNRWAEIALQAQLHPVTVPPERLREFAGTYGPVTVEVTQDALRMTRKDRPKWPQQILLSPLTDDGLFEAHAFAFDDLRVRLMGTELQFFYGSTDSKEAIPRSP